MNDQAIVLAHRLERVEYFIVDYPRQGHIGVELVFMQGRHLGREQGACSATARDRVGVAKSDASQRMALLRRK